MVFDCTDLPGVKCNTSGGHDTALYENLTTFTVTVSVMTASLQ